MAAVVAPRKAWRAAWYKISGLGQNKFPQNNAAFMVLADYVIIVALCKI